MASTKELIVKIGADTKGLDAGVAKAKSGLSGLKEHAAGLATLGAGLTAGITAPIVALGAASVKAGGEMQQTRIAFETMLGSAEKATSFIKELEDFARKTPFEFEGLLNASKRMLAFGFQAQQVLPTLTAIGDSVAALGGGSAMVDRVTLALGQMQAKGKVSAQEMMQLAEAGIPAWEMLAEAIGVSIPEAMKMSERGAIDAATAIDGLVTGMSQRFGGLMDEQSKTMLGQMSNLQDTFQQTLTRLGESLLPIATIAVTVAADIVDAFSGVVTAFSALPEPIQTIIVALAGLAAAIGPIFTAVGAMILAWGAVGPALTAAGAAIAAVATGPISGTVLAVGALLAAGAALSAWYKNAGNSVNPISQAFDKIKASVGKAVDGIVDAFSGVIESFKRLTSAIAFAWKALGLDKLVQVVFAAILRIVETAGTAILGVFEGALRLLSGAFDVFAGLLTGDWRLMWDGLKNIVGGAVDAIVSVFGVIGGIVEIANEINNRIMEIFATKLRAVKETVSGFVGDVYDYFANLKTRLLDNSPVPDIIDGITEAFGKLEGEAMVAPTQRATGQVLTDFQTLATDSKGIFQTWADGVKSVVSSLNKDIVEGLFSGDFSVDGIKNKLKSIADSFKDVFVDKALGYVNKFVNEGLTWLMGKLDNVISKLASMGAASASALVSSGSVAALNSLATGAMAASSPLAALGVGAATTGATTSAAGGVLSAAAGFNPLMFGASIAGPLLATALGGLFGTGEGDRDKQIELALQTKNILEQIKQDILWPLFNEVSFGAGVKATERLAEISQSLKDFLVPKLDDIHNNVAFGPGVKAAEAAVVELESIRSDSSRMLAALERMANRAVVIEIDGQEIARAVGAGQEALRATA